MQGNIAQNAKYISKEGKPVEVGIAPMSNGKKRMLMEYKKQIEIGEDVLDIAGVDEKFDIYLQYRSALTEYAKYQKIKRIRKSREVPEV